MLRSGFAKVLLAVFGVLMTAMASRASVVLNFTGAEGNQSGGVYVYPYDFTIGSSSDTTLLMCDDFSDHITSPETWTANTQNVSSLTSTAGLEFSSASVTEYLDAAYLFTEEVDAFEASNSDSEGLYNWAVWDLFTGTDPSGSALSSGDETTVQGYLSAAEAQTLTPSQFSGVVIYTPLPDQMESDGPPQEFFGYNPPLSQVPEPSTLALLGIGSVSLLARRRNGRRI